MTLVLLNLMLALVWTALTGEFTALNLVEGFVIGFAVLWVIRRALGPSDYFRKVPQLIGFALYFIWELVVASLRVAVETLTPKHGMRPGVVAVPLDVERDYQITLLANLITLTPGTLALDVSADQRVLYVHTMYLKDEESFRQEIKNGFERRVREVFT